MRAGWTGEGPSVSIAAERNLLHGNLAEKTRPKPGELPLPALVPPIRITWPYATGVVVYHRIALRAFVPWFFSWAGVLPALFGLYVFGMLGIKLCCHRLLTHRGLVTSLSPRMTTSSASPNSACDFSGSTP